MPSKNLSRFTRDWRAQNIILDSTPHVSKEWIGGVKKNRGGPCERGETAAKTGCIPVQIGPSALHSGPSNALANTGQNNVTQPTSQQPAGNNGSGGGAVSTGATATSSGMEGQATRPGNEVFSGQQDDPNTPSSTAANKPTADYTPADPEEVKRKLHKYEEFFLKKNRPDIAAWVGDLYSYIDKHGIEEITKLLGEERTGEITPTAYAGWSDSTRLAKSYLKKNGIILVQPGEDVDPSISLVSGVSYTEPTDDPEAAWGLKRRPGAELHVPINPNLKNKLEEAKHLPGLETTEDLSVLMGGKLGEPITHFTPEVIKRLDEVYGKDKWIVKSYSDAAYAGYGIYFPQRVKQLNENAKNGLQAAVKDIRKYGLAFLQNSKTGDLVGVRRRSDNKDFMYGTREYANLKGDGKELANKAYWWNKSRDATALKGDGKSYMAQPAFPAVGVTDADRAQGLTYEGTNEGRVHMVTRNGKAEAIPYATWLKGEQFPVVFQDDNTKAMQKAAVEAINNLPESERQGQVYAPDVMWTQNGYKVVEANPSNQGGASGYLQGMGGGSQFAVDAYVSHLTGREPGFVRFIRNLVQDKKGGKKRSVGARVNTGMPNPVAGKSLSKFTRDWRVQNIKLDSAHHIDKYWTDEYIVSKVITKVWQHGTCVQGETAAKTDCNPGQYTRGPQDLLREQLERNRTNQGKPSEASSTKPAAQVGFTPQRAERPPQPRENYKPAVQRILDQMGGIKNVEDGQKLFSILGKSGYTDRSLIGTALRDIQSKIRNSTHSSKVHTFLDSIKSKASASGVSEEVATKYSDSFSRVISRMSPGAAESCIAGLKDVKFYKSLTDIADNLIADHPEYRTKFGHIPGLGRANSIGGYYGGKTGVVHLDGQYYAMSGKSDEEHDGVYAHELGHAIDQRLTHSNSETWRTVAGKEINQSHNPLSAYARTNSAEAFAEFSRLLHDGKTDRKKVEELFPLCSKYWKDNNLW